MRRELISEADVDRAVAPGAHGPHPARRVRPGRHQPVRVHRARRDQLPGAPGVGAARRPASPSRCSSRECCLLPLDPRRHRTVAVVGTHADVNYTDWYSGSLPYACTVRDGLAETFGSRPDPVRRGRRPDRPAAGRPLPVRRRRRRAPESTRVSRVRRVRLGQRRGHPALDRQRDVPAGNDRRRRRLPARGELDRARPSGRCGRCSGSTSARTARWRCGRTARPATPTRARSPPSSELGPRAARFTVEKLVDGAADAADVAAAADAVVRGDRQPPAGQRPGDRGPDRPQARRPPTTACCARSTRPTTNTALVLVSSYPYAVGWADAHLPAVLWMSHGGQELGPCAGRRADRRGRPGRPAHPDLVPQRLRAAGHPRLRHHHQRRHLPVLPRHPALPVRARPVVHHVRVLQPGHVAALRRRRGHRDGDRVGHQHRPADRHRGGAALHPPAAVPGQAAAAPAARLREDRAASRASRGW